ncbi:exosome complex component Rrp4p [Monosporozyma servazzii]
MSAAITVIKKNGGFQHSDMVMNTSTAGFNSNDEDEDDINVMSSDSENEETNNDDQLSSQIVTPGELITDDPIWMRGHGTYFLNERTYSSVAGTVSRVNRLLSVIPLRGRYAPETGDHIIGRIVEVGNKRWKVDIGAKQYAVLMLGSVNLPGGILRRKSESDELQMRTFLKEGDLLNAEVQSLFQDGSASLHTRSLKYGKLRNGLYIQVPSALIVRAKNHTHNLPGNITVVLGVNGYIWLRRTSQMDITKDLPPGGSTGAGGAQANTGAAGPTGAVSLNNNNISITRLEEESSWQIYSDENDPDLTNSLRLTITRYANVIKALAYCEIGITQERIVSAYEASMSYPNIGSLIEREVMESLGADVINGEKMRGNAL